MIDVLICLARYDIYNNIIIYLYNNNNNIIVLSVPVWQYSKSRQVVAAPKSDLIRYG